MVHQLVRYGLGSRGTLGAPERSAGITVANRLALRSIDTIPARLLTEINERVSMRLITKASERRVMNLTKAVLLADGHVGGSVDAISCNAGGRRAHSLFRPAPASERS